MFLNSFFSEQIESHVTVVFDLFVEVTKTKEIFLVPTNEIYLL